MVLDPSDLYGKYNVDVTYIFSGTIYYSERRLIS